jgi:hypothetical protein
MSATSLVLFHFFNFFNDALPVAHIAQLTRENGRESA